MQTRRAAEDEVRKRAELLSHAHDAVVVRDVDDRIIFWNRGATETYGWTADEALGRISHELLQTTFPIPQAVIAEQVRDEGRWEGELGHLHRNGRALVVASRWALQRDDDGAPLAVVEINWDITARKQGEAALIARERELRLLVDGFPGMIIVANADGIMEYCNRQTSDYLGKPPIDAATQDARTRALYVYRHMHPDDQGPLAQAWERCNRAVEPLDFHYRLQRADGVYRWMNSRAEPLVDEHGKVVRWYNLLVDVDDQRNAEAALRASQAALAHVTRVTTLGEVTASLAHEVNQPLAAIVNNANACLGLLPDEGQDETRAALGDIASDALRASAIVQRVRALAKRSVLERAAVQLKDVVDDVVALAASESLARRVTVRTEVAGDLPIVLGDRVQLQQLLLNLVLNGMDAMSAVEPAERVLRIDGRAEMETVVIGVCDRGVGLSDEDVGRLFEAFYTTKPHGLGMGIAISRSIVEAHDGRLWAEPNDGAGATFRFALPVASL